MITKYGIYILSVVYVSFQIWNSIFSFCFAVEIIIFATFNFVDAWYFAVSIKNVKKKYIRQ